MNKESMAISHFLKSLSGTEGLEIEQRIFNVSSFSISVFALVGTVINYIIGLNMAVVGLSFIGSIIAFYLFYLSRYRNKYSNQLISYYLIAIITVLGIMYFYNNGLGGTVAFLIIVLLNVFILVAPARFQYKIAGILFLFYATLLILELNFPGWITPYSSRGEAVIDHMTTMFYSMGLTTYVIINFRNKMLKDRREILKQNKEIQSQKMEIESRQQELQRTVNELQERNTFIETLLRELSHRVKNNLQLVISILDMQIIEDEKSAQQSQVQETKNRLTALILVHQRLYGQETGVAIFMPDYIKELCESIEFFNKPKTSEGEIISYYVEPIDLNVEKVISLGLIINEIITNSFKHAFQDAEHPNITIRFRFIDSQYHLQIEDNGSGFVYNKDNNRTGMSLIHSLTKQLNGKLTIDTGPGKGSSFSLNF
ncbi:histidine kinase dimerization/phosphoacceptor domain -containing protein [Salegentibacter sp. F188]|uniref:histidine kinase n=1 Tax=Autumnicola patrickiae TaxID=3075591 RepID=A0ABU3E285_9FLAO|nr:histidine kinase dimerization/phosphoacceptor domain -containing protein [Salegentibacter sp. F188]MDT0690013.1 histidine kinase dimerization/phosphoacceptor domain -containing protein [Salegentibacter sp. F188]